MQNRVFAFPEPVWPKSLKLASFIILFANGIKFFDVLIHVHSTRGASAATVVGNASPEHVPTVDNASPTFDKAEKHFDKREQHTSK